MNSMVSVEKTELETVLMAAANFLQKHHRVDLALKISVEDGEGLASQSTKVQRLVSVPSEHDYDEYPLPAGLA